MVDIEDIISIEVGDDELNNFYQWAFGCDFDDIHSTLSFMRRWNEMHGDTFKISTRGDIYSDVERMIALYKNKKNP